MPYFINPAQEDNCVFLTCEGDMTLAEITTAWREVQGVLAKKGWKRVLMDVTALRTTPKTEELFDLAKTIWLGFPQCGRMALVVRWEQSKIAKLLETLVRSVGMYLTIFVREETAEAWILGKSPGKHPVEEFAK
jgi:hypothetical protein